MSLKVVPIQTYRKGKYSTVSYCPCIALFFKGKEKLPLS